MLKLYNSLTKKKQAFRPISDKKIGMYSCGITAYYSPHIGNMRRYLEDDVIKRVMLHDGFSVTHVENVTDVGHLVSDADTGDDKLRLAAEKEHKTMKEVANFYAKMFYDDCKALNILQPDIICRATEHIQDMIALLEQLDSKGYLYKAENGMYFDTSKFKNYGKLTGLSFKRLNAELKEGARVEKVEGKRHATDFAVWRFASPDQKEMVWDTKWGRGFPGWHIECSAMSMKYLGKHFDVHTGGIDHLQIHHPNEIAQSEAATGEKFVNFWIHHNFLLVDSQKMSKSLKNIYTVQEVLSKGYSPMALRLFLISGQYRQQQNFTFDALSNAESSVKRLHSFIERLSENRNKEKNADTKEFKKKVSQLKKEFFKQLDDDINMPEALARLYSIINETNSRISLGKLNRSESRYVIKAMVELDEILGLGLSSYVRAKPVKLDKEIQIFIDQREEARMKKDFKKADEIRAMLKQKFHVVLEDTKDGVRWHKE